MFLEKKARIRPKWAIHFLIATAVNVLFILMLLSCRTTTTEEDGDKATTVQATSIATSPSQVEPVRAVDASVQGQAIYYVSTLGNNRDGSNWQNAWNEFDQIEWEGIGPGSVILIDGGETSMRYATPLLIGAGGSEAAPITLRLASEAGRNGQVILDGGGGLLPECGNSRPAFVESIHPFGIDTQDQSWIVIDGTKWRGIVVRNFGSGMLVDRGSTNIDLRYVEFTNNGFMREVVDNSYPLWKGGWGPDGFGIKLGGSGHRFSHLIIHDNGGDQIQSLWQYNRNGSKENNLSNFELTRSWLYNGRRHSTKTIPAAQIDPDRLRNLSFNFCVHADGVQIHDGGTVRGITITESVIGPGQTNNLILGTKDRGRAAADVHDLLLQDLLLLKGADSSILSPTGTDPQNWTIDHVTVHCMDPYEDRPCIKIKASDTHLIRDSIFFSASDGAPISIKFFDGDPITLQNVCVSGPTSAALNSALSSAIVTESPFAVHLFTEADSYDYFSLEDYTVDGDSPCAGMGSRIPSVDMLLQR